MSAAVRIRKKKKCISPNPLFEQWLTEWREEAALKGLKSQYNFSKALSSLRKYPLPLASGKEAKVLQNFGDKICSMLDDKLQQHNLALEQNCGNLDALPLSGGSILPCTKKRNAASPALPKSDARTKVKRIFPATESIRVPCPVIRPVAIENVDMNFVEIDDQHENGFSLQPGTFNILLCVDSCETSTGHSASRKQFLSELKKCGMEFEVRKLHVGDFLWIAKEKANTVAQDLPREVVLDFIVERKRLDDLSHSIKDGRFREQKFRLKSCGLQHPIYLVEYHGGHKYTGIPESTLEQAIVNTQVVDGFIVQRTQDIKESVAYLAAVTKHFQSTLQMQVLKSGSRQLVQNSSSSNIYMTFEEFNRGSMKNKRLCVKEMFAKHLLQFCGLSVDRAAALVDHFGTPARFFELMKFCTTEEEQIKVIAEMKYGKYQRNVSQTLGKLIHQFYTVKEPLT